MKEFEVHMVNNKGVEKAVQIQSAFEGLCEKILDHVSDDRCKAVVLTKLEEACFYAKKGMALNPLNQEKEGL